MLDSKDSRKDTISRRSLLVCDKMQYLLSMDDTYITQWSM